MFGAAHQRLGGITPFLSMWLVEDAQARWRVTDPSYGPVDWIPRSPDRVVADALVLLVALTSTPRDPVPLALTEMAGASAWRSGVVDLPTWRHYDGERLDALVAATEPAGKVVLLVLPEASVPQDSLASLEHLDWDLDVLTPRLTRRRLDRDLHQAPPPGMPGPALPRRPQEPRQHHVSQRPRWWT